MTANAWEHRRGPEMVSLGCLGAGLELSPDGLLVRNRSTTFQSVRADVAVAEGAWYYELQLHTAGLVQVGWAT